MLEIYTQYSATWKLVLNFACFIQLYLHASYFVLNYPFVLHAINFYWFFSDIMIATSIYFWSAFPWCVFFNLFNFSVFVLLCLSLFLETIYCWIFKTAFQKSGLNCKFNLFTFIIITHWFRFNLCHILYFYDF